MISCLEIHNSHATGRLVYLIEELLIAGHSSGLINYHRKVTSGYTSWNRNEQGKEKARGTLVEMKGLYTCNSRVFELARTRTIHSSGGARITTLN
jgi:hypothetical protein